MQTETIHFGVEQCECERCENVNHGEVTRQPDVNRFEWECGRCGHIQEL